MYFWGIGADKKSQKKKNGFLFSEGIHSEGFTVFQIQTVVTFSRANKREKLPVKTDPAE